MLTKFDIPKKLSQFFLKPEMSLKKAWRKQTSFVSEGENILEQFATGHRFYL